MALLGEGFSTSWVCWLRGELFSFFRVGWSLLGANAPFTSPNQPRTRSNHPPSPGFQDGVDASRSGTQVGGPDPILWEGQRLGGRPPSSRRGEEMS